MTPIIESITVICTECFERHDWAREMGNEKLSKMNENIQKHILELKHSMTLFKTESEIIGLPKEEIPPVIHEVKKPGFFKRLFSKKSS